MTETRWIIVTEWERYQHRDAARSKVLPWIKNETSLLSSPDYIDLSGHRRAVLHGLWLEYARSLRRLRLDTLSLTRQLNLRVTTSDIEALNHAGFITLSASKPARNHASTPAAGDREGDKERVLKNPKSARARTADTGRSNVTATDPEHAIRTMVANGVIRDHIDLDAELVAAGINGAKAADLHALIP